MKIAKMLILTGCTLGAAVYFAAPRARAQDAKEPIAWAPKPDRITPLAAPTRFHWKLSELLAAHTGYKDWTETLFENRDFIGQYISMGPGEKTKTVFYGDERVFWVIQTGQVRFYIEGLAPFIASKGFLVQVPYRTPYSMETVGGAPSLRFEVRPAGALPLYPVAESPTPVPGQTYIRAAYSADRGSYDQDNRPYIDFNRDVVQAGLNTKLFIRDEHTSAHVMRRHGAPRPPDTDVGHFHENLDEVWFVLEGQVGVKIEGEPYFTAEQGDVIFGPPARNLRVNSAGDGMSAWMALTPRPADMHLFPLDAARGN